MSLSVQAGYNFIFMIIIWGSRYSIAFSINTALPATKLEKDFGKIRFLIFISIKKLSIILTIASNNGFNNNNCNNIQNTNAYFINSFITAPFCIFPPMFVCNEIWPHQLPTFLRSKGLTFNWSLLCGWGDFPADILYPGQDTLLVMVCSQHKHS